MASQEPTNPPTAAATDVAPASAATEATPATAPAAAPVAGDEAAPAAAAVVETPLDKFITRLPSILTKADHTEIWGIQLPSEALTTPSKIILQKFLRANNGDLEAAEKQLVSALEWRKKVSPNTLLTQTFDEKKFNDLGFVTTHRDAEGRETVITWNIYGAVKDRKMTFGDVDDFIRWRAALMELSIRKLGLDKATALIPDDGPDPYQMVQVHDYKSLSFFRLDAETKAASKETIRVMGMAYPELLSEKFFVNVPAIMGWLYGAMKLFLAPATLKKFHPMSSGLTLATELTGIAKTLPKDYGGEGEPITAGSTIALAEVTVEKKEVTELAAAETKEPEVAKPAEAETAQETKPVVAEEPKSLAQEVKPAAVEKNEPSAPALSADEVKKDVV